MQFRFGSSRDPRIIISSPQVVARELLQFRHRDGANQLGDEIGCNGKPYSDYTMYRPVNPVDRVIDPDRWQPLPIEDELGNVTYPGFLTPHWYRVKTFALTSSDQFRAPPPPLYGSEQMEKELKECVDMNATLSVEQKAVVEFMRDGPRSTGQSGHWLRFAQALSRRDGYDLDQDVKLYFVISNVAIDAFIACWETKRFYDSSRPWTMIRCRYANEKIFGWAGPGQGVKEIMGSQWHPYLPKSFVTPPFPGYVSGHSTVSAACATALKLFSGSDRCEFTELRYAGELTEAEYSCEQMQRTEVSLRIDPANDQKMTCDVTLAMPTFWSAAEMAGISRVLGGYHFQSDNSEALKMDKTIAEFSWLVY